MKTATAAQDLAPGIIVVERTASGFYLVQIGRTRYTKRFNLSKAEAQELIEQLASQLTH